MLSCQKENGNWTEVENSKIFKGNYDGDTIVSSKFAPPIECKALRIFQNDEKRDKVYSRFYLRSEVMVILTT